MDNKAEAQTDPTGDWRRIVAAIFDSAAVEYARSIAPVLSLLTRDFVRSLEIQPHQTVLDVGTGTGLALREAANHGTRAIGIDISRAMLTQGDLSANPSLVQADMHELPLRSSAFSTVVASFALNSSEPAIALEEAWRVLRSGAQIALQEWDEADEISELLSGTFADYCVDNPPPDLAAIRQQSETPIPWDRLESIEDLVNLVRRVGFEDLDIIRIAPVVKLRDGEMLLRYKLAWPIRRAEFHAMPAEVRELCLSDVRENLAKYLNRDGTLDWRPNVIRIIAVKP